MTNKYKLLVLSLAVIFLVLIVLVFLNISKNTRAKNLNTNPSKPSLISPSLSPSPRVLNQGQADKNYSNSINQIYSNYPWYEKLPITTDSYFVYFDPDSKHFVAKIYNASNQINSTELNGIENKIRQTLSGMGANLDNFPIDFKTGY
jgi:hypothetical protein